MENINALLRRAALSYYNGKPMMSDAEFDRLSELCNFEEVGHSGGKIKHYYGLPQALGGLICIKAGDFEILNGFPNFFTWGFEDNKIKDEEINNYFLSIVFFIFSLFILSGILSFEQVNFKDSLTLSILTITNTVNSNNYNLNEFYFSGINITSKISLMLFMIIGRVELLSFLILMKKFFYK